jgi:exo-beta-1,3-glucanase (GH17 family)/cellulose synthase/poly-beta-1,6-N-acetylglucosamine synthase-like glycosyltransferase
MVARDTHAALLHSTTILAVLLALLLAACGWAAMNRPAPAPAYGGRIGGLSFSPFRRGESPAAGHYPTQAELRADLRLAARMTGQIRTYTVQGVLGEIPALAQGLGLHITAGAWLDRNRQANRVELDRLVAVANANPDVERVLVGNETLLRHDLTVPQLIAAMRHVRQAVHVPVSTAEPWDIWLKHPELAAASDYITIHVFPYWVGIPADHALPAVLDWVRQVQATYPDKHVVIGEVGWPSDGVDQGAAHASRINQAVFLRGFLNAARRDGLDYFVLEAFDQPWKTSVEGRAAGYWGMLDLDRHAKWPMTGPVWEMPHWRGWAAGSIGMAAILALLLLAWRPDMRLTGKLLLAGLTQGFVATLAAVLMVMSGKYLSAPAALVWGLLAAGQGLLLLLLLADSFELAEILWARRWRRPAGRAVAAAGAVLPKVSIHLPICNEPPLLVRQTLDALARLDYPDFEVLVVDNNTTDPALWEPVAEYCARLGGRFRFFHLGAWPGFKAGALNFALRETAPDAAVIGVLDSDYVVRSDWLRAMVPHFADATVGIVQSPQDYRDGADGLFKRLMFWEYAGFFRIGMVARNERNAIIQHGTMSLIRHQAIVQAGGWAEWTITEDAELGLRLFRHGWQAVYAPESFGRGVMPDDFAAYRRQRARWAYGAMQICRAHAGALVSPFNRELTAGQRWHFLTGWLPWLGDALGLLFLLVGLAWSVGLILAPKQVEFPIALFMLPSVVLFGFKLAQIMALYRGRVPCGWADRIGAAVAGLGLSHTIGKAVWKGLLTSGAPFLRTPKLVDAPALVQGLAMAWEEMVLLLLTWGALVGVGIAHRFATPEARLWCALLATQSLPYLAAVGTSLVAALPARRPAARAAAVPNAATLLARSGAGD